jgi:hypothetical protein
MAFGLLTLLAYIRYAEAPSRRRMALVTGLLVLGLMAKPMLVTLPFVLLLLDWWPLRRVGSPAWIASPEVAPRELPGVALDRTPAGMRTQGGRKQRRRTEGGRGSEPPRALFDRSDSGVGCSTDGLRLLLEKAPLFIVVLLSCAVTYLVQSADGVFLQLPVATHLENATHSYVVYLEKFVFPTDLACFYPLADLGAGRIVPSVGTLAVLTLMAWRLRARRPYLLMGWLWFVGALVPMIGLVQVGEQAYADRYMYFPSLGLGFVAALGLAEVVGRTRLPRPAVIAAGGAVLAAFGVATWRQTLVWRNTIGLFEHAKAVTESNWFLRLLLAEEFIQNNEFERAEAVLREGGALHSGQMLAVDMFVNIRLALSRFYDRMNREEDALREIDAALAVEPENWHTLVNRGIYLAKLGRDAEAASVLQRAIALETGNDPELLRIARRTLAAAERRLGGDEDPEAAPVVPR